MEVVPRAGDQEGADDRPEPHEPEDEQLVSRINKTWHKLWGDRRQEIVFIGTRDMDRAAMIAELDACLMQVPESGSFDTGAWSKLPDPFPAWVREAA